MMWLAFCLVALSGDAQQLWEDANLAFQEERFAEAIEGYEKMIADGVHNGKVHYNLGNAYYRHGRLGKAILNYHRALEYLPGDADITANLALANQQRQDPPIDEESENIAVSFNRLAHGLPYSVIFWLALACLLVGGIASVIKVIKPESPKFVAYILVIGWITGLIFTGAATIQHGEITRQDMAIITSIKVDVLSGPSIRETVSFTIHEGIGCRILDENDGWYRIRLANGYNGWVRSTDLEII